MVVPVTKPLQADLDRIKAAGSRSDPDEIIYGSTPLETLKA